MKKRHIIKYLFLLSMGAFIFTGCNNLDQMPYDKHTDETYWQSVENSELLVNMAYNQMYGAGKMWTDEALSDNVIQARDDNDPRKIRNGLATPSLGLFASEWKWAYEGIKTCHKYLENVDRVPGMEENLKATRKAEIRFIRAFLFFRLAYFYGDVPFFTEDITLAQAKTISRTQKSVVLQFVHDELDEIIDILPSKGAITNKGRITNAAAVAFQARAYLYENNWPMVEKYTDMLINQQGKYGIYELFGDYESLFQSQNKYNNEVILDYGYATTNRTWTEMYARVPMTLGAFLNSCAPIQALVDDYWTINGYTISKDPAYNPNSPYTNRDPRLTASVVYDGFKWVDENGNVSTIRTAYGTGTKDSWESVSSNKSVTGYYTRKYFDPQSRKTLKDYAQENNIIMFRYADVLLMYAEAMLEQNKMNQSVWDATIKKIRSRAGFTAASALNYPSTLSTTEMRELIHRERRIELVFEGLRYYDIVRWKEGTKYLNGVVNGAKFANNNSSYITLDSRKFNEGKDYLWSVPIEEIVKNPNLKPNNPGYSE